MFFCDFLHIFHVSRPSGPLPVWVQCRDVMGEPRDHDAMALGFSSASRKHLVSYLA